MSDLISKLEAAQAFKDGTPFQTTALDKCLRDVIRLAEMVVDEIKAQKVIWPGEVDTLEDKLAALSQELDRGNE